MMDFMRTANPGQILIAAFKSFKTVVDKPIVEDKINDTVQADADTNPKRITAVFLIKPHQSQSNQTKKQAENIVQFKKTVAFLVVRFMDKPKWPVEKKLVHRPGNNFHSGNGKQDHQDWKKNSHHLN